eukprot:5682212-Prymnesium_polylepis.2
MTHSPPPRAAAASCKATSADEHAVSMLVHGPCTPSTNDNLPAATEIVPPVAAYTLSSVV